MNDRRTFASTKALLEAARADAPTRAVRAEIWSGVSDAVGLASASAAAGAAASGAKALALTTLFGGAVTVGVAATLLWFGLPGEAESAGKRPGAGQMGQTAPVAEGIARSAATPAARPSSSDGAQRSAAASAAPAAASNAPALAVPPLAPSAGGARPHGHPISPRMPSPPSAAAPVNDLAREASLVARAQAALAQSDPSAALRAIAATRSLSSRQLEPEELAVAAQALRALGRGREADEVEARLKSAYPLSELVR